LTTKPMLNEMNRICKILASSWRWKELRHEVCHARETYNSVQLGIIWVMQTERLYKFHTAHKNKKQQTKLTKKTNKQKTKRKQS